MQDGICPNQIWLCLDRKKCTAVFDQYACIRFHMPARAYRLWNREYWIYIHYKAYRACVSYRIYHAV